MLILILLVGCWVAFGIGIILEIKRVNEIDDRWHTCIDPSVKKGSEN